jgi:site-specific DNA recombinase
MSAEHKPAVRCAIYTRKSSEEGLEQSFNSLDAQREACQAFILSQRQEGWRALPARYDDGGYSGGNLDRPALQRLLADVEASKVDTIVVYKVDRLTRSLADFAKIVEALDSRGVSFVSVTQQFNTTSSMGRLTLNVLLSFAQFEREVTGERIRDKIAASKRKGMWMGGVPPLGYDLKERKLIVNPKEAQLVCDLYRLYLELGCVSKLKIHLDREGIKSKVRISVAGNRSGGNSYSRGALYEILKNRIYRGEIAHRDQVYAGEHEAIVPQELWDRVQAQLRSDNQGRRTGIRATAPSLLVGLLQDANGNGFTPTHAVKNGRRYRYYVCQPAKDKKDSTGNRPTRLPAHEIESLVLARLRSLLQFDHEIMDQLGLPTDEPAVTQQLVAAARNTASDWRSAPPQRIHELVSRVIKRVVVHQERVELYVSRSELRHALIKDRSASASQLRGDDLFVLEAEAKLKRCGGEVRLVLPPNSKGEIPGRSSPSLLKAIARAHDWRERIVNGSAEDLESIAKQAGLNQRYVSRILECAFLAPDIVEAILDGRQPHDLTVQKLWSNLPSRWAEQRKQLRFRRARI